FAKGAAGGDLTRGVEIAGAAADGECGEAKQRPQNASSPSHRFRPPPTTDPSSRTRARRVHGGNLARLVPDRGFRRPLRQTDYPLPTPRPPWRGACRIELDPPRSR